MLNQFLLEADLSLVLIFILLAAILALTYYNGKIKKRCLALQAKNDELEEKYEELAESIISQWKANAARDSYKHLSETDRLTGVLNKAAIEHVGSVLLELPPKDECCHAMVIIDLDHFKEANDTCGHQYGDEILKNFASHLKGMTRSNDYVGRFGGDEFILLLNSPRFDSIHMIAGRINKLACDLETSPDKPKLSASIGIALYPTHGKTYAELFKAADEALYEVKQSGRNGFAVSGEEVMRT